MTMIISGSDGLEFPDGSDQTSAFTGNAATITSGTLNAARLPSSGVNAASITTGVLAVSNGGTGLSSFPAPGTSGNVLTSNGTGWVSSPVAAGVTTFTATGSITAAAPVMLNNDGTVSALATQANVSGSRTAANSTNSQTPSVTYDTANKRAVFCYSRFNGSIYQLYALVGSLSGTTLTFGSETLIDSVNTSSNTIVYEPTSGKVVITYRRVTGELPFAVVGTVSGTSISFGSPVAIVGNGVTEDSFFPAVESGKITVVYRNSSGSQPSCVVGTISGTSISFGTPVNFANTNSGQLNSTGIGNNKIAIIYNDASNFGNMLVGTISGTSISFGTPVVYRSSSTYGNPVITKTINDGFSFSVMTSNGSYLIYIATVSGTVPAATTVQSFGAVTDNFASTTFIPALNSVFVSSAGGSSSTQEYRSIVVRGGGGAATFTTTVYSGSAFTNNNAGPTAITVSNNGSLIMATQNSSGHLNYIVVSTPAASNYPLLIGVANASVSNGASVAVTTFGGTATNQTSLITNSAYWVNSSGLSLSSTNAVLLGKAISSTSMIITGGGS
jgi:hypothetical protein